MKRIYLLITVLVLLFCFMNTVSAQSTPKDSTTVTLESLTKDCIKTKITIEVYQSKSGSYFTVRKSKKTGKYYKSYIPVKKED